MKAQSIVVKDMHFDNIKLDSLIIQKKYVDKEGNANVPINKFMRVLDEDVYVKIERFTDNKAEEVEEVFAKIKELQTLTNNK